MRRSSRASPRRKCAFPWFQSLTQEWAKSRNFRFAVIRLPVRSCACSCCDRLLHERLIQVHVVLHHAIGGEPLPRAVVSEVGVREPKFAIGREPLDRFAKRDRIILAEVARRLSPNLPQTRDVIRNDRATRKRSFHWREPER